MSWPGLTGPPTAPKIPDSPAAFLDSANNLPRPRPDAFPKQTERGLPSDMTFEKGIARTETLAVRQWRGRHAQMKTGRALYGHGPVRGWRTSTIPA